MEDGCEQYSSILLEIIRIKKEKEEEAKSN